MKKLLRKYFITILGTCIGAIAGYLYYRHVGCVNGTCSITSSPVNSTLYGILMGGLLFNSIESLIKKKENG